MQPARTRIRTPSPPPRLRGIHPSPGTTARKRIAQDPRTEHRHARNPPIRSISLEPVHFLPTDVFHPPEDPGKDTANPARPTLFCVPDSRRRGRSPADGRLNGFRTALDKRHEGNPPGRKGKPVPCGPSSPRDPGRRRSTGIPGWIGTPPSGLRPAVKTERRAPHDFADGLDRLETLDVDHRDQARVLRMADRPLSHPRPVPSRGHHRDGASPLLHPPKRAHHRIVLDGCGHHVVARPYDPLDRQIEGGGGVFREDEARAVACPEELGEPPAGGEEVTGGTDGQEMRRASRVPGTLEGGSDGIRHAPGLGKGGCRVVEVDESAGIE